mmetsp:Transcript_13719/g.26568  ORF Transcript_13719/g.26568 Transcript_13719/m.26568 type:complete len:174 (-) Transcript_13719:255-776(-)
MGDDDGSKRRPCSLIFLTVFSYLTLFAALLNGVSYVIGLIGSAKMFKSDAGDAWYLFFLNLYGLLFAIGLVFIEVRYKIFYDHFPGFKNWVIRGFYIIFVGILSLGLATGSNPFEEGSTGYDAWESVRKAFAYILVGIGLLYILGEIFCVRKHMQKVKSNYVEDGSVIQSSLV